MKKYFLGIVFLMIVSCSGCSLLPHLTFDRPGTIPTSTEKGHKNIRCAGEMTQDVKTGAISCSKGFYSDEQNYSQVERTTTLREKIMNFLNGLVGWGFWLLIPALIFVPGLAGWLIGRVFNVFHSALTGTVKAIGNFKANVPTVTIDGKEVADPHYAQVVDALLDELENEHAKDPAILKTISDIRVQLKVADND